MPVSQIRIAAPRQNGNQVNWTGELRVPSGARHEIYFQFTAPDDRPYPLAARPFLLAFLLPAMNAGAPLELDLPVDAVTLANLMEFQEAMATWEPRALKVVPIRAPAEPPPGEPPKPAALTAFSGGVDSNFTVWRHGRHPQPDTFRRTPLDAGLMVQGFDIPLDQDAIFASAWRRSRSILEAYGLQAYRMKTNLRSMDQIPGCEWSYDTHGIWLAAALACYEPWFGRILIPSTYAYPVLKFPWGSNPVTDPLFSSAKTAYWHDGSAFNKLTKMQGIASEPAVQKHLRVCWEGRQLDRNCGHCWKCMATQVCFWLCGVEQPEAFPDPCTLNQLARINIETSQNYWLMQLMTAEARRQGKRELAQTLNSAMAHHRQKQRVIKLKKMLRPWKRK